MSRPNHAQRATVDAAPTTSQSRRAAPRKPSSVCAIASIRTPDIGTPVKETFARAEATRTYAATVSPERNPTTSTRSHWRGPPMLLDNASQAGCDDDLDVAPA